MKTTIIIGAILAILRVKIGLTVEPESMNFVQVYKDAAHLFIGGLAVAWYFKRLKWQWYLFWALNVLEVLVAILSRI